MWCWTYTWDDIWAGKLQNLLLSLFLFSTLFYLSLKHLNKLNNQLIHCWCSNLNLLVNLIGGEAQACRRQAGYKFNFADLGYILPFVFQIYYIFIPLFSMKNIMQDITNSGLWYLCQFAEGFNDGPKVRCFSFAPVFLHLWYHLVECINWSGKEILVIFYWERFYDLGPILNATTGYLLIFLLAFIFIVDNNALGYDRNFWLFLCKNWKLFLWLFWQNNEELTNYTKMALEEKALKVLSTLSNVLKIKLFSNS